MSDFKQEMRNARRRVQEQMAARMARIDGNLAYLPLTRGLEAVIDLSDLSKVEQHKWYALKAKRTFYAVRTIRKSDGRNKMIYLHRTLMDEPTGNVVDHRDGNGLMNIRSNLRVCTHVRNSQNADKHSNNTSGYKGVSWHKQRQKWKSEIRINQVKTHLGVFDTAEEAYAAYCEAAATHHGEFARGIDSGYA